ncbi:MAG: ATPase, T2SS/T4P/T4SS family [Thalassotalea sp.]|nr:ATPase, T2SS/T4P/T4SS family [Thalassotalea sp.]
MVETYKTLKEKGLEVFKPLAQHCLTHLGSGRVDDEHTSFLIVLCKPNDNSVAYIVSTEHTASEKTRIIQNTETALDKKYKFVSIDRIISDRSSVDSFLQDAKEIKLEENNKDDSSKDDSPSLVKFKNIISEAVQMRASDIHYYVGANSAKYEFRIDGVFSYEKQMNSTEAKEMMSAALNNAAKGMTGFEDDTKPFDLPIEVKVPVHKDNAIVFEEVTLRLSRRGKKGYPGYKAVMRVNVKSDQSVCLENCNYPEDQEAILQNILNAPYGIFLATGPVGSGKSTTSSAMLEMFDQERGGLTVEDPIEFDIKHPHIYQFQVDDNNPEMSLSKYLKVSLRQDPDLISVAEIRDTDVAKQVFEYSRVGTVMMSTLHTNEAIYTYPRLLDLGITVNELSASDTFLGILNQRLLRKICPHCKLEHKLAGVSSVWKHNPKGCDQCVNGRLKGRITVSELLIPDVEDARFIQTMQWKEWRDDLIKRGFKTLALRAFELSSKGIICWDEVETKIPHARVVQSQLALFPMPLGSMAHE